MSHNIKYLSPSSIAEFYKDREKFYIERLAAVRSGRLGQTQPMSIGSAFDAYVKSDLHSILFGPGADPRFEFENIFVDQVEPHNRDWALVHGKECFQQYRNSGAYADLLQDLQRAKGMIRFESKIEGSPFGVPLLGKPDLYFINEDAHPVILDWKVNGWCGKGNTSPKPGYVRLRSCFPGGNAAVMHKDCFPKEFHGVRINGATTLDEVAEDWAAQEAIYGWLYGEAVGADFVCAIDQIACHGGKGGIYPECRVAEHRLLLSPEWQRNLVVKIQYVWQCLESGHIFTDVDREESDKRCASLEARAAGYANNPALAAMVRESRNW